MCATKSSLQQHFKEYLISIFQLLDSMLLEQNVLNEEVALFLTQSLFSHFHLKVRNRPRLSLLVTFNNWSVQTRTITETPFTISLATVLSRVSTELSFRPLYSSRRKISRWACDKSRQWHFTLLVGSSSCHFTHKMSPATPSRVARREAYENVIPSSRSPYRRASSQPMSFRIFRAHYVLQNGFIFKRGCIRTVGGMRGMMHLPHKRREKEREKIEAHEKCSFKCLPWRAGPRNRWTHVAH